MYYTELHVVVYSCYIYSITPDHVATLLVFIYNNENILTVYMYIEKSLLGLLSYIMNIPSTLKASMFDL